MCVIAERFSEKFKLWNIAISDEEVFVGSKQTIPEGEWYLKWVIEQDERGMFLEYYGIHFKHGHLHERIYENGKEEKLNALRHYIAYAPSVPGDREKSLKDFEQYNNKVIADLKEKGLFSERELR